LPATIRKYYYTHAPASDIDFTLFKKTSLEQLVHQLRVKRKLLETNFVAANEPFVLVHGDFNGRNIMMRGLKVMAVQDWEFSGTYPLSELVAGSVGVDVVETVDDDLEEEKFKVELENLEYGSRNG
jgi:Phosphotransferase enzyme family